MKTIITKVENNRVVKFLPIESDLADDKLSELLPAYPDAFIYDGEYSNELWVENGIVSLKPIIETPQQTIARLERALDAHLDAVANSYRYESIRNMVTYVGDPNSRFNAEGVGALNWRSACYTLALMIINEVNQGRPAPTEEELIAEMPSISEFIVYPA